MHARAHDGCVLRPERYTKGQTTIFGIFLPDELVVPLREPFTEASEWVGRVASAFPQASIDERELAVVDGRNEERACAVAARRRGSLLRGMISGAAGIE